MARENDWSLLNQNQTPILFGRYRNEPWTDHKPQIPFARIPKRTEEYQIFPYQLPKYRTEKRTNTDHLEWPMRQRSLRNLRNFVERF